MYNLITTITSLPALVGCKEFPNDQQGMSLVKLINDFINEEYRYDGKTVIEAFKMAVKRELYLDGKRIDPSTFGQHMSVNVVGQVLTAYKESKRDSNARPQGYNPKQISYYGNRLQEPHEPIKPHEAYELILKWCNEDGKLPFAAPYDLCYQYLVEKGALKAVEQEKRKGRYGRNQVNYKRLSTEQWFTKNVIKKQTT